STAFTRSILSSAIVQPSFEFASLNLSLWFLRFALLAHGGGHSRDRPTKFPLESLACYENGNRSRVAIRGVYTRITEKANKKRIVSISASSGELEEQEDGSDPSHHHNSEDAGQVYGPLLLFFRWRDADAEEEAEPAEELN